MIKVIAHLLPNDTSFFIIIAICSAIMEEADSDDKRILAQFKSENGDVTGNAFDLPLNVTADKLQLICNALLANVSI